MLQFLSPLALLAIATVAIPAVLHLWRPPAQTIRVGTLQFFTGPAVRRLTKLRWRERLLLAVRVLLLTLLAFLLAQPIWNRKPPTSRQRWALVEPGAEVTGEALKRWRELKAAGFEMRQLTRGFPPASLRDAPVAPVDTWSLLRELDARLPAGSTIAVFSSSRIAWLRGERPALSRSKVEWIVTTPNELSPNAWISSVQLLREQETAVEQLRITLSTSTTTITDRIITTLPATAGKTAAPGLVGWSIEVPSDTAGKFAARLLRDGDRLWATAVSARPLSVAIVASADRADDARYVGAAVRAIGEVSGQLTTITDDASRADWVLWLNDDPVPENLVREVTSRGGDVLSDAENSGDAAIAQLSSIEAPALAGTSVPLFRRTPAEAGSRAAIWRDGFGSDLLTVESAGAGKRSRFFSRFHPDWNDLPRSSALAAALRPLLTGDGAPDDLHHDQRIADASQSRPAEADSARAESPALLAAPEPVDLHTFLWLVCVALFALERVLSHRRFSAAASTPPVARREEPALSHV